MSETLFQLKHENSTIMDNAITINKELNSSVTGQKYRIGTIKVKNISMTSNSASLYNKLSHQVISKTFFQLINIDINNSKHATGSFVGQARRQVNRRSRDREFHMGVKKFFI